MYGLHQDSILCPYLFSLVTDALMQEVNELALWTRIFMNEAVIGEEGKQKAEEYG